MPDHDVNDSPKNVLVRYFEMVTLTIDKFKETVAAKDSEIGKQLTGILTDFAHYTERTDEVQKDVEKLEHRMKAIEDAQTALLIRAVGLGAALGFVAKLIFDIATKVK